MTGRYEFSTGCNFDHGNLSWDLWQQSYPVSLKQAGYFVGFAGKFGLHVDREDGGKGKADTVQSAFDWWGGWMGQGSYEVSENKEAKAWFATRGEQKEHTTHALGLMGQDFIRKAKQFGRPFCLSISFKAPHSPYHTDPRYWDVYDGASFPKPDNYGLEHAKHIPDQAKAGRPFSKGKSWLRSYDKTMAAYHTMVYGMDRAIGMMLRELEAQGIADNTVVIFTSDNGHFNGSKAMGGKIYAYEEGSLAPLIVLDPRSDAEETFRTNDALTANIDIAPTILDYAGIEPAGGVQGESLLPLLSGKESAIHQSLMLMNVWGTSASQALGVVTRDFKYIRWFYGADGYQPAEELYDMRSDRLEEHNLISSDKYAGDAQRMRLFYDRWLLRWAEEGVARNGYPKYTRLGDRGVSFDAQSPAEILAMNPEPKTAKTAAEKKADKAAKKARKAAAE
jgi:arylsulfatase A-like enzyme